MNRFTIKAKFQSIQTKNSLTEKTDKNYDHLARGTGYLVKIIDNCR
jgi:hypothetical protein